MSNISEPFDIRKIANEILSTALPPKMRFRDDEQRDLYEAAYLKGRMKYVATELSDAFAALQVDNIPTALSCISRAKMTAESPIDYGVFAAPAPVEVSNG